MPTSRRRGYRPTLEVLEDRSLLSTAHLRIVLPPHAHPAAHRATHPAIHTPIIFSPHQADPGFPMPNGSVPVFATTAASGKAPSALTPLQQLILAGSKGGVGTPIFVL